VSLKHTHSRLYQINKKTLVIKRFTRENSKYEFYQRELIPLQRDRINHLFCFNNMNCK